MTPNFRRERAGFTLIELLVVIAIIALLAALIIAFFPSINAQTAEANGAANLQGWLNIARQKAIRNQNPFGLRLWVNSQNIGTMQVVECQYIEQPDDVTSSSSQPATASTAGDASTLTPPYMVTFTGIDLTGGFAATGDSSLYTVQPGDYLEVLGTGLMHQITGVSSATLTINTPIPFQLNAASNFRILRQARPIGEEMLALPTGVVIDLNTNTLYSANGVTLPTVHPTPTGFYVDVLFSPSGAVISSGVTTTSINLWVRQPDANTPANVFAGNPTIIAIFAQTGLVGAYPPSVSAGPYADIH